VYCDLHTHTTASDGSLTPLQLIDLAMSHGLAALGITDHDTVAGLPIAVQAAKRCGLPLAWGIELSVEFTPGTLHMLGYFIDIANEDLRDACTRMQRSREGRNAAMLDKLREMGMPVAYEELSGIADFEDTIGRPHIADAMVARGYVKNREEAFVCYLGKQKPAYVERTRLPLQEAIDLITNARGVAVLAHPFSTGYSGDELKSFLTTLKDMGMAGVETHYFDHSHEQQQWLSDTAAELGLVQSGGSDYHGPNRPETNLAVGAGDLRVPFDFYDDLRKAAGRYI